VYNEEECIPQMHAKLFSAISDFAQSEIIYVNDGSVDRSMELLSKLPKSSDNIRIKVVEFTRNFGHEAAMTSGILQASGDCIVCMDADLQHPPARIRDMVKQFERGSDIVLMRRNGNDAPSGVLSKLFYLLWSRMANFEFVSNASDFFLLSKRVKSSISKELVDKNTLVRGVIQRSGFDMTVLDYDMDSRFSGESKYTFSLLVNLALYGLFSYSKSALRISFYISAFSFFVAFGALGYSLVMYFNDRPFSGYTSLISFNALMFALLFLVVGILSEYVGLIHSKVSPESKFIIKQIHE
jgi:dolichol-phosphate mannosyltransferase